MKSEMRILHGFFAGIMIPLLILFTSGCRENAVEPQQAPTGNLLRSTSQKTYSTSEIAGILSYFQIPDSFQIAYSVEAVAVTYLTSDAQGNDIQASGALLIPQGVNNLPILSIQHGTETKRDLVASVSPLNSVEGVAGLLTASMGYVTCIPDYQGFGVSQGMHPYMHSESLTTAVIDFLRAARAYCTSNHIQLNNQLFLVGYSEGGFVTLATQKKLEESFMDEFTVSASAPMAGPYDLKGTADFLFQQTEYNYPAYIAFLILAYDELYKWNSLDEIFNAPYNTLIPTLFDGSKTFGEINSQLPAKVDAFINPEFISSYFAGSEAAFQNALEENSLLHWTPIGPIHFFHGDADDVSPYQNTLTAIDSLTANGAADILLTTFPGGTHATAGLPSLIGAIRWIESMRNNDFGLYAKIKH